MIRNPLYSIDEVERMAKATCSAFRKDFSEVFAAGLWGNDRGVPFVDSVANVNFIKGKVVVGAGLMSALINASGIVRYEIRIRETDRCVIDWFVLVGGEWTKKQHPSEFTTQRAVERCLIPAEPKPEYYKDRKEYNEKLANWKRAPWVCDRLAMNYNRALAIGARLYALHVFGGAVYTADELNDPDVIDVTPIKQLTAPSRPALPQPQESVSDEMVRHYAGKSSTEIHRFVEQYQEVLTKDQLEILRLAYAEQREKAKREQLKAQLAMEGNGTASEGATAPESATTA